MALPVKIASSFGLVEYWSFGKSKIPNLNLNCSFHYSITPALHYFGRRSHDEGKTIEAPPGGNSKPGPLGPDSLFCFQIPTEMVVFRIEKGSIRVRLL